MSRLTPFLLALLLLVSGAGCAARSGESGETLSAPAITVTIARSEDNSRTVRVTGSEHSLAEALKQGAVPYRTAPGPQGEMMAELDGVVATASKTWNLYINGAQTTWTSLESVTVRAQDRVEWRYETK